MKKLFIYLMFNLCFISYGQSELYFEDVQFSKDTRPFLFKSLNSVDKNYPISNLFDGDFKTCWIISNQQEYSDALIKLPAYEGIKINIFQGYGKSKALYYQNARPEKLHISFYYGLLPEGYYSESETVYKMADLHKTFDIRLKDKYGIQTFSIPVKIEEFQYLEQKVKDLYKRKKFPEAVQSGFFISISLDEIYKGTKYQDVCISELFFNRPYEAENTTGIKKIERVYTSNDEHSVYIDTENQIETEIYNDKERILSIEQISDNKEWAVAYSEPAKAEGRVETSYLLFDLINKKEISNEIKLRYKDYVPGSTIYFNQVGEKLFLVYYTADNLKNFIELKHK